MVAADVGQPGDPPAPYTMGYIVVDNEGRVVASKSEKLTLSPQEGRPAAALSYLGFGLPLDVPSWGTKSNQTNKVISEMLV